MENIASAQPTAAAIRPNLRQLFLLTATIAICLAIVPRILFLGSPLRLQQVHPTAILPFLVSAIAIGCFAYLLINRHVLKHQYGKFLAHPGHWMIAIAGIMACKEVVDSALSFLLADNTHGPFAFTMSCALFEIPTLILLVLAIFRYGVTWLATVASVACSYSFLFVVLVSVSFEIHPIIYYLTQSAIVTVSIALAVYYDWRLGKTRDWLHWLGVGVITLALPITTWIALAR